MADPKPTAQPDWCERLYERKSAELLLYGRALGLSHAEAEDVLQETFMALLVRTESPEKPDNYCVRAFRNRALNLRRTIWRRLTRELESRRWFESSAEESESERAAVRCLRALPAEQREVIVLKVWHRYTFEELGELLEISPNTAAGRYRYGMRKLHACLTGKTYDQHERTGEPIAFLDTAAPFGKT